jgi:hypothetical protein
LAREWFLALARAVGYLHDRGIVHRDLKPANVFLEDGIIKVGDYGLCKSISASAHSRQTESIGTVHYMAPEISTGKYNKQIDIYACGVLLYEMLTGQVPFEGESPAEILMKHLTSTPDVNALPAEYRALVAKALAKDPSQRYASMAEFALAVETMSLPSAKPVAPPAMPQQRPADAPVVRAAPATATIPEVTAAIPTTRGLLGELSGSMALAAILGLLTTVLWFAIIGNGDLRWAGSTYFLTVALCWTVLIPSKLWTSRGREEMWGRRLTLMILGAGVGIFALWLDGWNLKLNAWDWRSRYQTTELERMAGSGREMFSAAAAYVSYFVLSLGLVRWWRFVDRRRKHWFSILPLLVTGFWAVLLTLPFNLMDNPQFVAGQGAAAAVATAAVLVQLVSPHDPPPLVQPRRLRYRIA